jgi:serine/threonine-protein kinase
MTPERYERLCELFDRAQPLAPAERAAFLDGACAGDPALRAELEGLLAHDERARREQLLQGPCPLNARALLPPDEPHTVPTAPPAKPDDALVGRRVGPYRIEQRVGRGGMGSVYRALRQEPYRQQVAVKVLRGGLGGEELVRRFAAERQALADLGHPHIARLLDGGTTDDGRPYLVLEYIDGEPLDRHCDRHQLGTRQRVELLRAVCAAVQHAHARGVLHRDLKPGNVLVAADGTAKVTDFGLAKQGDAGTTATGEVLGTPSYMAPEQAGGRAKEVSPATDVYGLGATLYELLTGRPPFRGETPLDTLAQVVSEEPVPPGRLHPKLPRDLGTICLKCLEKDPRRRYASAAELADDLGRFLAGEPIRGRPVGRGERSWRWCRRHPGAAALAAAVLLLVLGGGGGGLWWRAQRAEQAQARAEQLRAVRADLAQVADLLQHWKLAEARTALVRAEARAVGGPAPLREEVRQMREQLSVADALDRIRLRKATVVDGRFDDASADRDYAAVFRARGLGEVGEPPGVVAGRLRGSPIRAQLVAALDDWAHTTEDRDRRTWLLAVARAAEPGDWGDRFRDVGAWDQRAALERLAREAEVAELSPQLLTAVGLALARRGADSVPLLKAAQRRHPADFWLNLLLGNALLLEAKSEEAAGYYRAALALRPDVSAVYNNLGGALAATRRWDEAVAAFRRATALDPTDARAHYNLGGALAAERRWDEAVAAYRRALALDPKYAPAHNNLGVVLRAKGEADEAIRCFHRAITLDRKDARARYNLGLAFAARGQLDEAIGLYRRAIDLGLKDASVHHNLGNALKARGRPGEAIAAYRQAVRLDPKDANAHGALGEALLKEGKFAEAKEATGRCLDLLPPGHPLRKFGTQQLRECERCLALEERLSALFQGKGRPADAAERIALAQLCQRHKKLYAAAARFYAEAFAEEPCLGQNSRVGHRYDAACAAAQAAGGQGEGAANPDDQERSRLRRQALDWLRADLAAWATLAQEGAPQDRQEVRRALSHWRQDPDLAGVREPAALARLPEGERQAWRKLWADVAALLKRAGRAEGPAAKG